eukprot:jgi/Tetstr1/448553/TSEL_035811.t1
MSAFRDSGILPFDFERVRGLIYDFNLKHRNSQPRDVAAGDAAVLDMPPSATEAVALLLGMQNDVQPAPRQQDPEIMEMQREMLEMERKLEQKKRNLDAVLAFHGEDRYTHNISSVFASAPPPPKRQTRTLASGRTEACVLTPGEEIEIREAAIRLKAEKEALKQTTKNLGKEAKETSKRVVKAAKAAMSMAASTATWATKADAFATKAAAAAAKEPKVDKRGAVAATNSAAKATS